MIVLENFDELLDNVRKQYNFEKARADRLQKELKEFNAEEQIRKKNQQIQDLRKYSLKVLSEKEYDALESFKHEHYERHKHANPRTAGTSFIYRLTGVGIGTCIEVTCPLCEETLDITDTSSW